jgi:hypothetical protein
MDVTRHGGSYARAMTGMKMVELPTMSAGIDPGHRALQKKLSPKERQGAKRIGGIFAFQMLSTNTPCQDLGDDYFDRIDPQRVAQKLIRRLESLGLEVHIIPQQANA